MHNHMGAGNVHSVLAIGHRNTKKDDKNQNV